jgi:NADPH-dependent 2,4-dienoyl-CoA reductase/sulfur reductase-like enzyme/nitrite reductase/ring-hydroxylating ferredoxin subunit
MSSDVELKGPDFSKDGVAAQEVAEGSMLLGHADGEPVLLARSQGKLYAMGAVCSHYGGPLAEGLLTGDHVRCPWHHAQFCLKDGKARAPALNPVTCWKVEENAGRARVTGKAPEAPPAKAPANSPSSVVIIGGGAAGNAAAETLRDRGYAGPITMLSADESVPVDRPNLSKDYLAGSAQEEWIPLRGKEFYAEKKIELLLGTRVTKLDAKAKTVTLTGGKMLQYGALLLATGSEPNKLSIPGADLPHVYTLRTLADSRAIIVRASKAKKAVVVGASFIGLEVAASLKERGLEVHVVAPEAIPLEKVLGKEVGELVRKVHEEKGVVFHLSDSPVSITAGKVTLKSGATLDADLVVAGVGVKPSSSLAQDAGLTVDKGVVVDEHLQTSAKDVYAAGDVARYPDRRTGQKIRIEHWVVAERQGEAAARNMLGEKVKFADVPFFWSNHYKLGIRYIGHSEKFDQVQVSGDLSKHDAIVAYREAGIIRAIATIGRDKAGLEAEAAFERDDQKALERLLK